MGTRQTFVLTSASQFRPSPPAPPYILRLLDQARHVVDVHEKLVTKQKSLPSTGLTARTLNSLPATGSCSPLSFQPTITLCIRTPRCSSLRVTRFTMRGLLTGPKAQTMAAFPLPLLGKLIETDIPLRDTARKVPSHRLIAWVRIR